MNNFWENIARYPRFFISAMLGLLLILISPFQKLLRTTVGKIIFGVLVIGIGCFISITLKNMLDI
jgi:hypothetical protein|tara:strand:+ start:2741 stop:2935 length:195 start_codon:yes stop_codon:yes gene_type:complete